MFLMFSSTLPIVFPVLRLDDGWIADGGLADNLPIRPLLKHGCTRIFVVHLNPTGKDTVDNKTFDVLTKDGLLEKLKWQERLEHLEDYFSRVQSATEMNGWSGLDYAMSGDPILDPNRKLTLTAEIIHIVPSRSLGSFVTGTLNFTGKKARWLMELGERDMDAALDELNRTTTSIR
jgi:predicted acylesterase/phospholipase RssA